MSRLIPVIYNNMNYPAPIEARIHEVSGNFKQKGICVNFPYSLHTEPAYGYRKPITFAPAIVNYIEHIQEAIKNNVPQLWYDGDDNENWNGEWAREFYVFIEWLIGSNIAPEILEIHPPFNNYCTSFEQFIEIYSVFYDKFKCKYPTTTILIENRFGTMNTGGKFLLSTCSDILEFCEVLKKENIYLKIVIDYPQLFSEVYISTSNKKKKELRQKGIMIDDEILDKIISFNQELKEYKEMIGGFHMWGKRKDKNGDWVSHAGNFDDLFSNNKILKEIFLKSVFSTFNDKTARYFVPEVRGIDNFHSIVADMKEADFTFAE